MIQQNRRRTMFGITVVTSTKRPAFMSRLLRNFNRQQLRNKELIVVLNGDRSHLQALRRQARPYRNVTVYHMPGKISLGACLNYAIGKSKYAYVAKFDDDDYYAPGYLTEAMRAFIRTKADIVGKRTHWTYLEGRRSLLLRFPTSENRQVKYVSGATLAFRKQVWRRVRFLPISLGEDVSFCRNTRKKGFRIYSTSRRHFVVIRRKNKASHTWKHSDQRLLSYKGVKVYPNVGNYQEFIKRR